MTESDKAVSLYSKVPKEYNCAQSVAKAFGRDDLVVSLRSCSGGRAEGGLCGALYAAMLLLPEVQGEVIQEQFRKMAGDITCRAIRQRGTTPCTECVRIAANFVAENIDQ